ncbi:two component Sigma-54 specific, transcriptional regulator, Fis famliy [Nitrosococcus oceani ATCC 19707]|uniref:Two component Sigma-54 specific, transcriptional regulator, Fis famliy n=1 Tax=Nitrosococcus oceani (strain ATCC 19707 / BCRC 17464 / JCM 30415 / NCIMB 11848 / C-107) TaxID=323261 RepID=Q3J8M7_NITOC|nr:sigma-54 dependent transcriptional regulator [Nitrosococcus oceani]ABA58819.1 two component Sigma-54 specific, transcriptional regulator, Fis famliy [Nitrosococcus oceani ATCC 19707]GEM19091.1 sigma-54-dependent Fis family transcriptional regulator [Nitrosococcus oceani]
MMHPTVLVVEHEPALREALCATLSVAGFPVKSVPEGKAALVQLEKNKHIGLLLSDIQTQPLDSSTLLRRARTQKPDLPVLFIAAHSTIHTAIDALDEGAVDYLLKPFETKALLDRVRRYVGVLKKGEPVVAVDPCFRRVVALAQRVAKSEATVLLSGESGTGKEVLARYIYRQSPRCKGPFVAINCAAIPENRLEATLFGYEKGAFTGAYQAQPGKFELAQGGTLLLDEISEIDLGLQAKLLRVLQEREVERLGGGKMIPLDIRILATTNRDLQEQVANGRFREDLYYRLNVFPLYLPPLRERSKDILPLARRLAAARAAENGRVLSRFSLAAEKKLLAYPWPGNIRELDNVIQRAMILADEDELTLQSLVFDAGIWATPISGEARELNKNLKDHEKQFILETLGQCNGRRKQAAVRLGVSERTLRYKLARLREAGVVIPDFPSSRLAC